MEREEAYQELIHTQGQISKKDLIEIINSCDDNETFLVDFLKSGNGTNVRILSDLISFKLGQKCDIHYKE